MFWDTNLVFYGTAPYSSASNFASMITTTNVGSNVISLGALEDLGIGDGEAVPKVAAYIGTAFTSACTGMRVTFQFQGSTDSSNWVTYIETAPQATTSLTTGIKVFPIDVPHRSAAQPLPGYYRLNVTTSGNGGSESLSAGTLIAGIVIQRDDNPGGQYSAGFSVV